MKTVVAAALGECVHVAGVVNFLRLAESAGWRTVFLGPSVSIEKLLEAAEKENASLVGVSYRLTPETGERLLGMLAEEADELHSRGVQFTFGGTPPVAEKARSLGFFQEIFDGSETTEDVVAFLRGKPVDQAAEDSYPKDAVSRIQWKAPFPLIRHHFGLPTLDETRAGISKIAEARVIDVISLGIDQDAQENFFHPERQDPRRRGAGGVPVRSKEDYISLAEASKRGNYPLLRTYSGTDDFIRLAELYVDTINIAWCAIPLFWFNQMDGRGPWDLEGSIREHQKVMAFYGQRGIPVELNEPHHWGMRDAHDAVFVVSAFLSAYNARAFGVKDYIAQLMFNSPPGHSDAMDLAKMLAVLELVGPLAGPDFRVWKQTRTGLLSYPLDTDAARAHLASSIYLQMALRPHIVHVVGHTEADHAANPDDVIEACKMARRSIENALRGQPDMTMDDQIQERKNQLIEDSRQILAAICSIAPSEPVDPFTDEASLTKAVTSGLLDAPHLRSNPYGRGKVLTRIDKRGACIAVDENGVELPEEVRISQILQVANQDAF
jgi:methylmalonyl-CoA mutase cobalamin-binding subunit